jgi:hypothetical protein
MAKKTKKQVELDQLYYSNVQKELNHAPWVLRVTEHNDKPAPVMIIKQRLQPSEREDTENLKAPRSVLRERGLVYGQTQLRCLPIIRTILSRVQDRAGIPLELHRFLETSRITFRGNLPLEEEAGVKLALMFKLQERIKELDRVELLARRIDRFTREEASYWYSRMTSFGPAANRWAAAGMKVMLAGHSGDTTVQKMLEGLRVQF